MIDRLNTSALLYRIAPCLRDGWLLVFEPVPVKSSVVPSGLLLTESEGNPGEIDATLGFLDGNLPGKQNKSGYFC